MSYELAEADRMVGAMLEVGKIVEVDPAAATARVQLGGLQTPHIPINALRAGGFQLWWMPSVGEQVMVAAPSGNLANAAIIASYYASNAPSSDANHPMINLAGGEMTVNGTIHVTGDVIASGVSLINHTHPHGDPAGNTGAPN